MNIHLSVDKEQDGLSRDHTSVIDENHECAFGFLDLRNIESIMNIRNLFRLCKMEKVFYPRRYVKFVFTTISNLLFVVRLTNI